MTESILFSDSDDETVDDFKSVILKDSDSSDEIFYEDMPETRVFKKIRKSLKKSPNRPCLKTSSINTPYITSKSQNEKGVNDNIDKKFEYIYILHSKQFDVDGQDTLYKFGCTSNIESRKFNSCYRTAFKYPCSYKKWYTILSSHSKYYVETLVKRELRKYKKGHPINGGDEMYSCPLEKIISIAERVMTDNKILYKSSVLDNFKKPSTEDEKFEAFKFTDEELGQGLFINTIMTNIENGESLNKESLAFIKEQTWIFQHEINGSPGRCCLCNRSAERQLFVIFSKKWGINAYVGSTCIKKISSLEYYDSKLQAAIKKITPDPIKILIDSSSGINRVDIDPCEIIYSYSLNDNHDDPESDAFTSKVPYKKNEEDNVIKCMEKYDPRGAQCKLITWMHQKNYTFVKKSEVISQINMWNSSLDKVWNVEVLIGYLKTDQNHIQYYPDKEIFIYIKQYTNEKNISDALKEISKRTYEPIWDDRIMPEHKREFAHICKSIRSAKITENGLMRNEKLTKNEKRACVKQWNAFKAINQKQIVIITGVAGSGKSNVAAFITIKMKEKKYIVFNLAPTGKAAAALTEKFAEYIGPPLTGKTIHSQLSNLMRDCCHGLKVFLHLDECSMIDNSLLLKILNIVKKNKNIRILLTGDKSQLSPVGFGSPFTQLIENLHKFLNIQHCHLNISMRGHAGNAQNLVDRIRCLADDEKIVISELKDKNIDQTLKFMCISDDNIRSLNSTGHQFITHKNLDVKKINNIIKKDGKWSDDAKDITIDMNNIKEGDNIMILKNGYDDDKEMIYFNGQEILVHRVIRNKKKSISAISHKIRVMVADEDGGEKDIVDYKVHTIYFTEKHLTFDINSLICYSDGVTVHKSQGSGFDKICYVIPDGPKIDQSIVYTALTRFKNEIVILYGKKMLNVDLIKFKPEARSYLKYFLNETEYKDDIAALNCIKNQIMRFFDNWDKWDSYKWKLSQDTAFSNYELNQFKKYREDTYSKMKNLHDKYVDMI